MAGPTLSLRCSFSDHVKAEILLDLLWAMSEINSTLGFTIFIGRSLRKVFKTVCVYVCLCDGKLQNMHVAASLLADWSGMIPAQTHRCEICWLMTHFILEHAASVSRSCRFTFYNIQKIRRYLTQILHKVQALVLSKLDYCRSVLMGLPACVVRLLHIWFGLWSAKGDTCNSLLVTNNMWLSAGHQ